MRPDHYVFLFSLVFILIFFIKIVLNTLTDYKDQTFAHPLGNVKRAGAYSLTLAMSPFKKETAYLHWPTYVLGIVFHAGIFSSFLWLFLQIFITTIPEWFAEFFFILFWISALSGFSILVKRIFLPRLRSISVPDDFFSNFIVTIFIMMNAISPKNLPSHPIVYYWAAAILIYLPAGKLKHALYFVPTRMLLGRFYGFRGTWPRPREIS